ncbi:glycogen debranching protein GlgX [Aureimonas populi]|uniref:Glycogen debranching protein GlgX n=1 Tax=Aureimonas populi TaxID=1701758 RepID=A0ABW5CLC4_9HYPH|nr:glycogen debranching protein GlgX [Aureimonas populi]
MKAPSITAERGCPARLGASVEEYGVHFAVLSHHAERVELCLFRPGRAHEDRRLALPGRQGDVFFGFVPGLKEGALYGLRAHGPFDLHRGHRFDAGKLLVDPYALRIDRPFVYDPSLGLPPERRVDTAPLVPRAIVTDPARDAAPLPPGLPGLTYELLVRGFSMRHPGVRPQWRGTVLALTEPAVLDGLERLGVETVELMPLAAWIDERHLGPLGLSNAWGYNPVPHMAPDPRLAPGGLADVRRAVESLHARGIRAILDVVLNHSGESDELGPTLSYRGLDNALYYRLLEDDAALYVNHTGTGNTFAAERPAVVRLFIDTLRTWVETTGLDGFRYDLAPVLGRDREGFHADAPFFRALAADKVLKDRIHVAEAWDIGPGGYRVGQFPRPFLEWHDRFRDDVRRFWRGEAGRVPALATRLSGSPDLYQHDGRTPSSGVNILAAHDGFTLADLVSFEAKHNEANGEANRDGHGDNHSWNNGVEGFSGDPAVVEARRRDVRALLATLFLARGTPFLVAGDEFGRTQGGNNNAYAQDNETVWLDWERADHALAAFTARLAALRKGHPALSRDRFFNGLSEVVFGVPDVEWLREDGAAMTEAEWNEPARHLLGLAIHADGERLLAYLNAGRQSRPVRLPPPRDGQGFVLHLQSDEPDLPERAVKDDLVVTPRSVFILLEKPV